AEKLDVAVAAIVLTLTELPNISGVKLTVDGQNITLSDGRVLTEPVLRPLSTNPLAF
ncbi:MAG TPA: sporulation protein, partial [Firmicutes bacterium]|nr:sporulation protein [Bacillota bacterium]